MTHFTVIRATIFDVESNVVYDLSEVLIGIAHIGLNINIYTHKTLESPRIM